MQRKIPPWLVCGSCSACLDSMLPGVQITTGRWDFSVYKSLFCVQVIYITVKPETLSLLNFGKTWFKEFWQNKLWRNAGKGAYFALHCSTFISRKALILLGGFTLKGYSLAIWPQFAKFTKVSGFLVSDSEDSDSLL